MLENHNVDTKGLQIKEDEKKSERSTPARINDSAQWLADNLHNVPMLIFFFGKLGGESTTFPVLWNLCLSARAEGLGTCITTLLKLKKDEVEEVLETPDDGFWHMHAMIPIGYPMGNWGIAQRKPANLSTFQDRWDNPVSFPKASRAKTAHRAAWGQRKRGTGSHNRVHQ